MTNTATVSLVKILYVQGENMPGYMPESENGVHTTPEDALDSLACALDSWADHEATRIMDGDYLDDSDDSSDIRYAEAIVEILQGKRSAEYGDLLHALTTRGVVEIHAGDHVFWVHATRA